MLAGHHHQLRPDVQEAPQRRYASLHRALDQGKASDDLLTELVHVCVKIGNNDEAVKTATLINSATERALIERWLASKGLLDHPPVPHPSSASLSRTASRHHHPSHHPSRHLSHHPSHHPSRPHAARQQGDWDGLEKLLRPSFKEELSGAFRFLFEDHMPLTVMVTALTFPLVIGLGGFLTKGTNELLLPVIALVPVLSVVVLVCALSRKIVIEAAAGMDDPPTIPELGQLVQNAVRFLVDSAVMALVFLGPAVACFYCGVSPKITIGVLALGIVLLPMALVLRQVRNDWQAFWPPTLLAAVFDGGIPYLGALVVAALLFVPAVATGIATLGSELYLQVSFAGPLVAMPLFVASRFTGRVLSNRSAWLKDILVDQRRSTMSHHAMAAVSTRYRSATQGPIPRTASARSAQTGVRARAATTGGVYRAASAPGSGRRAPARRRRARLDAPSHPEMSGTFRRLKPSGTHSTDARPQPVSLNRDESCRLFHKVCLDGDEVFEDDTVRQMMSMPGAVAVKGKERIAAGAASQTKLAARQKEEDK